jgi:hypothetical protein
MESMDNDNGNGQTERMIWNSAAYDIENDNFRIRACNSQIIGYLSFEDTWLRHWLILFLSAISFCFYLAELSIFPFSQQQTVSSLLKSWNMVLEIFCQKIPPTL